MRMILYWIIVQVLEVFWLQRKIQEGTILDLRKINNFLMLLVSD